MRLAQRLAEAPPRLAWQRARFAGVLYRRAFGAFGPGTVLVRPAVLRGTDRVHIGAGCAIYPGAWLACESEAGQILIGNRNYFGHRVHLHTGAPLTIGDDCVFADDIFISTTDHQRDDRSLSAPTAAVHIGDRVFLGQRVTVLGGVTIGDGATVGAHSVVTKDVRPGAVVAGVPAREIGG
jgi:acetyltransferase-like isoleucine patch superfamily enzyme